MPTPRPTSNAAEFDALHRQNQALLRQVDHLATLREISLAISGSLELNETLPVIANVVHGALDLRRFTMYEYDQETDRLRPLVAKYGDDLIDRDRLEEDSIPRAGTAAGQAIDTRSVVVDNEGPGSAAYVPLIAKGEPLGVILLEDRRDGKPFDTDDAALLRQLASHIAVALQNAQLYALAVTDGLTKLFVRRYFDLRLQEEFAQATRYNRTFAIVLIDLDHFKRLNDEHGHQTGDAVLRETAALLRANTRQADICCRYGGEEMAIILPETDLDEAYLLAEKLRRALHQHHFTSTAGAPLDVTASLGVAATTAPYDTPAALIQAADEALYEAKRQGRNRVEQATEPTE